VKEFHKIEKYTSTKKQKKEKNKENPHPPAPLAKGVGFLPLPLWPLPDPLLTDMVIYI